METPEGRTEERYRRAALSAVADAIAKVCGMALVLLGVSLTLPYLGPERFGIWVTITSLTTMLSLLDLGMGNALINRVASATAATDKAAVTGIASGGLATLAFLGIVVGAVLAMIAAVVPWAVVVKLHNPANFSETRHAAILFGVLFGGNVAATGVRSIFIGLQRAYIAHCSTALGYIAAILALWWGASRHADVPTLLLSTFGVQILSAALLAVIALSRGILTWPTWRATGREFDKLARVGSLFLLLQIGIIVGYGGDSLMIAHIQGTSEVAKYNIVLRLFQLVSLPLAILCAPLWGAYAEAKARGDDIFIRNTLRKSLSLIFATGSFGVIVISMTASFIIPWWTKGVVHATPSLISAFAIWIVVQGLGAALGAFLNGLAIIRPQIVAVSAFVIIGLPLKWWVLANEGLTGFVLCTASAYLLTHGFVYGILYRRYAAGYPVSRRLFPGTRSTYAGSAK